MHSGGPRFDCRVEPNGYAWWYIDALSDDGAYGLTVIAFIGSVFSPYYAWARRDGNADPTNFCALNVALYGKDSNRWSMTERGNGVLQRDETTLSIGRSSLRWTGSLLEILIDEICAPLPRRVRGMIRLMPSAITQLSFPLDSGSRHHWTPFAPVARIEIELSHPNIHWSGVGYFDANRGVEPLEDGFSDWTWSRASLPQRTIVLYDVKARGTPLRSLALRFSASGGVEPIDLPPLAVLPTTRWGIARQTRADPRESLRVVRTLEDAPFYSRSVLDTCVSGLRAPAIHESLNLNRFRSRWVQCLLPFRMPRAIF